RQRGQRPDPASGLAHRIENNARPQRFHEGHGLGNRPPRGGRYEKECLEQEEKRSEIWSRDSGYSSLVSRFILLLVCSKLARALTVRRASEATRPKSLPIKRRTRHVENLGMTKQSRQPQYQIISDLSLLSLTIS